MNKSADKRKINLDEKTILVTGSPGFIGAFLVMRLLEETAGTKIISLDKLGFSKN